MTRERIAESIRNRACSSIFPALPMTHSGLCVCFVFVVVAVIIVTRCLLGNVKPFNYLTLSMSLIHQR